MPDLALLQTLLPGIQIRAFEETASTNREACSWLLSGAQHGDLVIADRQTQGRGRLGRSFSSTDGGLYMTILLRMPPAPGPITTLCAVAVCRALQKLTDFQPQIKWVNDVQIGEKKVCGILCEGIWQGGVAVGMAVGIGVNLWNRLPEDLQSIARSLYPNKDACPISREQLAAVIYQEIMRALPQIPAHMDAYRSLCLTLGREVYWKTPSGQQTGTALDVSEEGALIVRLPDGSTRSLSSGEVSVRPV